MNYMMTNDNDRAAILSTMYQAEDEPDERAPTSTKAAVAQAGINRSRRIRVGAIEYEVPSIEYVRQLEQSLLQYSQMVSQQRRVLDRLLKIMKSQRTTQQSTAREL